MYIIKFGGSVITDKRKENCFKQEVVDNLAKEIKKSKKDTIIIHGAGSLFDFLISFAKLSTISC